MNGQKHMRELTVALEALNDELPKLGSWGHEIGEALLAGHRLLAVGNGGSAAQAQHLTAELVGRYQNERQPLSAISLHAETSSVTAIVNDYGANRMFARQVEAHGRPNDILFALSTSGSSENVLASVKAAHQNRLIVFALTGPEPNRLSEVSDHVLAVDASTPTVQEVHQVAIHLICGAVDDYVFARTGSEFVEAADHEVVEL